MKIVHKIVSRCTTKKKTEKEIYYMLYYLIERNDNVLDYLKEIDNMKGLLVLKGLQTLLINKYPYEMQEFKKHIQVRTFLNKDILTIK